MPASKSLNAYGDITQLLDAALSRGGLRFRTASRSAAITIRQKIYNYLTLYRKHEMKRLAHLPANQITPTPYDNLIVRIDPVDPAILSIDLRDLALLAQITILDGDPIAPSSPAQSPSNLSAETDPIEAAVLALAGRAELDLS